MNDNKLDDINLDDDATPVASASAPATAATATPTPDDPSKAEQSNGSSSNTANVFAWVAFILINAAFIALVSWGSFTNWWVGFAIDVVYAIVLLAAGLWLLRRNNNGQTNTLTSLIFLLAVGSIAVAGLYLPLNIFPCSFDIYDDDYYSGGGEWVTETGNLPADVQSWWSRDRLYDDDYYSGGGRLSNFAHFDDTGVTLFAGVEDGGRYDRDLWRIEDGKAPEMVAPRMQDPRNFIEAAASGENNANTNSTPPVCFIYGTQEDNKVTCTIDGFEFAETEETFRYPTEDLFYSNELLWFRAGVPADYIGWGDVLYSADPSTLREVSLYSSPSSGANNKRELQSPPPDGTGDDTGGCSDERRNRVRFVSWLFLSALPAFIAAVVIDFVHKVPSMPIGSYLSGTWLMVCLIFTVDPVFDALDDFFGWWSVVTAGPWLIVLALSHLTNRSTKTRRAWGTNFAALVYTVGFFVLLDIFYDDFFWKWAVMTIFVVPPLLLVSVITGHVLVLVLTAAVIMIDVWRLTSYILDITNFGNAVPVVSVVLASSGLLLGFLGYLLSKRQSRIQSAASKWAKSSLGRWVVPSEGEEGTNNGDNREADADV